MSEAWIIDACRTPRGIGKVGQGCARRHPPPATRAPRCSPRMRDRNGHRHALPSTTSSSGTSMQVGTQGGDLARMAALDAGYDIDAPSGVTIDRFCGSGITTVNFAAASIMAGMEDVVIAGGTEMMSLHPALGEAQHGRARPADGRRQRPPARPPPADPSGRGGRRHRTLEGISREALDELAYRVAGAGRGGPSPRAASIAASCPSTSEDGTLALDHEEQFPRPGNTTVEGLAGLGAFVRGHGRRPARRPAGTTLRSIVLAALPRPRDRARAPRRQLLRRRRRRGGDPARQPRGYASRPRVEASGARSSPSPTWATTPRSCSTPRCPRPRRRCSPRPA